MVHAQLYNTYSLSLKKKVLESLIFFFSYFTYSVEQKLKIYNSLKRKQNLLEVYLIIFAKKVQTIGLTTDPSEIVYWNEIVQQHYRQFA